MDIEMKVRDYKDLEVWKKSHELVIVMYKITKDFPKFENYGLASQLRRASYSVPANIAEGAAQNSEKEFLQFLSIASGSASELDTLIELLYELNSIDEFLKVDLLNQINKVSALLSGLKKNIYLKIWL